MEEKSESKWLTCMFGCKVDERKEVVRLDCIHFICSDDCIDKLKKDTKSGEALKCGQCGMAIPSEQLAVKIIPAEAFVKRKTAEDVELLCEYCIFDKPAISYCAECPSRLCLSCKELHPQMKKTSSHKLEDDISFLKIQQLPKILEEQSKCKVHGKQGDLYCQRCKLRICELCLPEHKEHQTVHLKTEKESLISKIEDARRLTKLYEKASVDIQKKRDDLRKSEYDKVMKLIGDHFALLQRELKDRKKKFKGEVTAFFNKLISNLKLKNTCVERCKGFNERFVNVAEEIMKDGEDTAYLNFSTLYENVFKELENRKTTFSTYFDTYVEKGCHVEVSNSAVLEAQTFLSKFGRIDYKLTGVPNDQQFECDLQVDHVESPGSTVPGTVEQSTCDLNPVSEVSLNYNVVENQQGNMSSSRSDESEKDNVGQHQNGELHEDSTKTVEVAVGNDELALHSCLVERNDKNLGEDGIRRQIGTKYKTKQLARKSTGCPQVTARSVKRARLAGGQQMEEGCSGVDLLLCRPSVQGSRKRKRIKHENPNFVYTLKARKRRRTKKSVAEEKKLDVVHEGELSNFQPSPFDG